MATFSGKVFLASFPDVASFVVVTGHTYRLKDDQWTLLVAIWRPYDKKRRQENQPCGGEDLNKIGKRSDRVVQDRLTWRRHTEGLTAA